MGNPVPLQVLSAARENSDQHKRPVWVPVIASQIDFH